ncbi:MAG: hypothetical protein ACREPR_04930, partial [Brasilonema sp.]
MLFILIIVTGVFVFLFLLERIVPLRSLKHSLLKRLFINFCVTALAFVANAAIVQPAAQFVMQWTKQQSWGL